MNANRRVHSVSMFLNHTVRGCFLVLAALTVLATAVERNRAGEAKQESWAEALTRLRDANGKRADRPGQHPWEEVERNYPIECDWMLQDLAACGFPCAHSLSEKDRYPGRWFTAQADADVESKLIARVVEELGSEGGSFRAEADRLARAGTPPHTRAWLELYAQACQERRALRLRPVIEEKSRVHLHQAL